MISAPASDDEGSTAATDGSTLRTSPAEHGGSVGSESGGSAIDSVAGEHSGGWFRQKKNPNNAQVTLNTKPNEQCYASASQNNRFLG